MFHDLLLTFFLSVVPLGELRVGIPYGLMHGMPPVLTFVIAIAGNITPVIFLLWLLPRIDKIFDKSMESKLQKTAKSRAITPLQCFYCWYKDRTHRKYSKKFDRLGALALVIFVAIPLPITGAWTGALAAYLFRIPPKKAFTLISIGVIAAGLIVSIITLGIL
ncbi:MAG: small multi-drug export protein [Candidatus Jacksonbacteria bacterium]